MQNILGCEIEANTLKNFHLPSLFPVCVILILVLGHTLLCSGLTINAKETICGVRDQTRVRYMQSKCFNPFAISLVPLCNVWSYMYVHQNPPCKYLILKPKTLVPKR